MHGTLNPPNTESVWRTPLLCADSQLVAMPQLPSRLSTGLLSVTSLKYGTEPSPFGILVSSHGKKFPIGDCLENTVSPRLHEDQGLPSYPPKRAL